MQPSELEGLDRDALVEQAEASGIDNARLLARHELIERLHRLDVSTDPTPQRGLFGRATELLARVVARGLHLPDAGEAQRPEPPASPGDELDEMSTIRLAELYAAQGHRGRAMDMLRRLVERERDNNAAACRLEAMAMGGPASVPARLEGAAHGHAPRVAGTARCEVSATPPDADECVAVPMDATTLFACWHASERTLRSLRASSPAGRITIRAMIIAPSWDGPRPAVRDTPVEASEGGLFLEAIPQGAIVRVALGWRVDDDFSPVAHSPALERLRDAPSAQGLGALVRRTTRGAVSLHPDDTDASSIERALRQASERWAARLAM